VAAKTSTREQNKRYSEQHGEQDIYDIKKRAMQQAARWVSCRREKQTSDVASGVTAKTSSREENERFSEQHGERGVGGRKKNERYSEWRSGRGVGGRKKRAIQ
jgi:hypothetical protein